MKKLFGAAVAALLLAGTAGLASAKELRLSHQWSTSDVRHKVAQIVADEVAAKANVDLEIKIFPSQSLFKAREQYRPLSRGQLDMTVISSVLCRWSTPRIQPDTDAWSGQKP